MSPRLEGKVAIVTGAGRGIGRGEALALAAEGAKVVVNDIGGALSGSGFSKSVADEVVAEIRGAGGEAVANYDTVATAEGGERIVGMAIDTFGGLDILVNNAGNIIQKDFCDMTAEDWDAVIKVHLYGHFNCTKSACIWFRKRWQETGRGGGRVINTSSIMGISTEEALRDISLGRAAYAAAKQGILGLTRELSFEVSAYGVTCNAIVPSAFTRLVRELSASRMEKPGAADPAFSKLEAMIPEGVAPLVVYLATDEAANINGVVFRILEGQVGVYANPSPIRGAYKTGRWTLDELCDIVPRLLATGSI